MVLQLDTCLPEKREREGEGDREVDPSRREWSQNPGGDSIIKTVPWK